MSRFVGTRLQTGFVIVLFLGSLGVLLYNTLSSLALPQKELDIRKQLRAAAAALAEETAAIVGGLREKSGQSREELDTELREVAAKILAGYPGVEGGFYVARYESFSGYAYPTRHPPLNTHPRNEPPPCDRNSSVLAVGRK